MMPTRFRWNVPPSVFQRGERWMTCLFTIPCGVSPFASRQSAMIYRQIRALACIATASAFSLHAPALPAAPIHAAASRPAVAAPQMNA